MKDFDGKVAVVTGAASGIGLGLAQRCAAEGMKVVLADVEREALDKAAAGLQASGASVLPVRTDVSDPASVEGLAQKTLDAFGGVHLVFNNAGVYITRSAWESSLEDWEWVLGVDLWGVIYGVRTFVPILLSQDTEGHIVNTSSMGGFLTRTRAAHYEVAKHGVVALSECLHYELRERDARIGVSVLAPGSVDTQIFQSQRNRPPGSSEGAADAADSPAAPPFGLPPNRMPPSRVAEITFEAIRAERFYIITHPESKVPMKARFENILEERNP